MNIEEFVSSFREAFGEAPDLPVVFRYTDNPLHPVGKIGGCFFKALADIHNGVAVSLDAESIGCHGGKLYTGFGPVSAFIPQFVSLKERYKRTPEMVLEFISTLGLCPAEKRWLEFVRIDKAGRLDDAEGVLFLATPDVLTGLVSWAVFDTNAPDAVSAPFGSGCSSIVSQAVYENRNGGYRCFLGLFDPSVRPWVGESVLSFVIPISRFGQMCQTMRSSCLFDTHAWGKVRERINNK